MLGLDLSLTSTGVAYFQPGHSPVLGLITSKGAQKETLLEREARQMKLLGEINKYFDAMPEDSLVVVEGPSYGSRHGKQWDRAGFWWRVVDSALLTHKVVEIPPMCRARYATGRGNSHKDKVIISLVRRYPDVDIQENNTADAFALGVMGCRALGYPVEENLPTQHLSGMNSVDWSIIGVDTKISPYKLKENK